jgi:hypothetical protein
MPADMRKAKVSPYLKGLSDDRARILGDIVREEKARDKAATRLARAQTTYANAAKRLATARDELNACDVLIVQRDARLNPNRIAPLNEWKRFIGRRGVLKRTIIEVLQIHAPEPITTTDLSVELQLRLGIGFETREECSEWSHNTVCAALKQLMHRGLVERLCISQGGWGRPNLWKWKAEEMSLAALKEQIEARGFDVRAADCIDEG